MIWLPDRLRRRFALAAVLCLTGLALAGCIKVDLKATIRSNDTVDGLLTAAVRTEAIEVLGTHQADEFVKSLTQNFPGAYREERYDDGSFVGRTVYFRNVPLEQFSTRQPEEGNGAELRIVHADNKYTLSGEWDLPRPSSQSSFPELDDSVIDSADFTVEMTFPGRVTRHNGELNGSTVTWHLKIGEKNVLYAQADQSGSVRAALIVLAVCVGLLLLTAIALYIQLRRYSIGTGPR